MRQRLTAGVAGPGGRPRRAGNGSGSVATDQTDAARDGPVQAASAVRSPPPVLLFQVGEIGCGIERAAGRRDEALLRRPRSAVTVDGLAEPLPERQIIAGLEPVAHDGLCYQIGRASWRERVCQYVALSVVALSYK